MKPSPFLRALLLPLSFVYGIAVRFRAWLYLRGVLPQKRLRGTVISVGNLTVGGTGKTPMTIWLAQRLLAESRKVAILTRGYRGASGASDEALVFQNHFGDRIPLGVGADRYATGNKLEQQGMDWFVLDDAFQHLRLARDFNIVLLDATDPFGSGRLLPSGRLREPRSALKRADAVVITRTDYAPAVEAIVRRFTSAAIFYAQSELTGAFQLPHSALRPPSLDWQSTKCFAFAAIGNPQAFFDDLRRWGVAVVGQAAFPDHYKYSTGDGARLEAVARAAGADALLCTEKDVFNLTKARFDDLPVWHCRISLRLSDAGGFWKLMMETISRRQAASR